MLRENPEGFLLHGCKPYLRLIEPYFMPMTCGFARKLQRDIAGLMSEKLEICRWGGVKITPTARWKNPTRG